MKDLMISIKSVSNGWIVNVIDSKTQTPLHDSTLVFNTMADLTAAIDALYDEACENTTEVK